MGTVFQDNIIKKRRFNNLVQLQDMLMDQRFMYVDFRFQQLKLISSEPLQLNNFYSILFHRVIDLFTFVDLTSISCAKMISQIILIFTDYDFLFIGIQLYLAFAPGRIGFADDN